MKKKKRVLVQGPYKDEQGRAWENYGAAPVFHYERRTVLPKWLEDLKAARKEGSCNWSIALFIPRVPPDRRSTWERIKASGDEELIADILRVFPDADRMTAALRARK